MILLESNKVNGGYKDMMVARVMEPEGDFFIGDHLLIRFEPGYMNSGDLFLVKVPMNGNRIKSGSELQQDDSVIGKVLGVCRPNKRFHALIQGDNSLENCVWWPVYHFR